MPKRLRGFVFQSDGSAAVEFALVVPILLAIFMAIMQISLLFIASQHLENATAKIGRLVRTGQAQGQNLEQAMFREALCSELGALLPCTEENILIDVQSLSDFGPVSLDWPVEMDGSFVGTGAYQPGAAGEIVVVRAFYQYPVWIPMIGTKLSNLPNGRRLLVASAAFRNEPF